MRAEDEEARKEPGRREQQETWPGSRAEGLECRAEEKPAFPPCMTSCRITCDSPQALCHLSAGHMEAQGLHGWWGQLRHLLKTLFLKAARAFSQLLQAGPSPAIVQG